MRSVPVTVRYKNYAYLVFLHDDGMASINGPVLDVFEKGPSNIETIARVKAADLGDAKIKAEEWLEANR